MKIGDKVEKRVFNGRSPDGRIGIVKKVGMKWRTVLVYWTDVDKTFWHCMDDLRVIND